MKANEIIQNLPLIKKGVVDDREYVELTIIKSTLLEYKTDVQIEFKELSRMIKKKYHGLEFSTALLNQRLSTIPGLVTILNPTSFMILHHEEVEQLSNPMIEYRQKFFTYLKEHLDEKDWLGNFNWEEAFQIIFFSVIDDIFSLLGTSPYAPRDYHMPEEKRREITHKLRRYKIRHLSSFTDISLN